MKKISRRSFLAVCGAMAATAALTACGGSSASTAGTAASGSTAGSTAGSAASGEVFELKLSTTQTDTSMIYQGLQAAADKVAEDTDGHVKVTIYPSSQLGGEEDMIDQALQGMGIAPNVIVLRADGRVGSDIKRKISMFCNVRPDCVIENLTMPSLYECPLMLESAGLTNVVARQLHLQTPPSDLTEWKALISRIATRSKTCTIALVGKYVKLHDAYLSVMESLYHAGFENESKVEIKWVDSEHLVDQDCCADELGDADGIIVPGGFGDRGIEGMIQAAQYARENHVPYFGICLGMQIMVMEYARNVLGYADANSSEFTPEGQHNVIDLMPDQQGVETKGGTMRLGKYPCVITPGTKMADCYGTTEIDERHRHRYEFNNEFRAEFEEKGLVIAGTSPDGRLVEAVEIPGRDFHLGAQFHPEFKSRPNRAHPLFKGFIAAALKFQSEHTPTGHPAVLGE